MTDPERLSETGIITEKENIPNFLETPKRKQRPLSINTEIISFEKSPLKTEALSLNTFSELKEQEFKKLQGSKVNEAWVDKPEHRHSTVKEASGDNTFDSFQKTRHQNNPKNLFSIKDSNLPGNQRQTGICTPPPANKMLSKSGKNLFEVSSPFKSKPNKRGRNSFTQISDSYRPPDGSHHITFTSQCSHHHPHANPQHHSPELKKKNKSKSHCTLSSNKKQTPYDNSILFKSHNDNDEDKLQVISIDSPTYFTSPNLPNPVHFSQQPKQMQEELSFSSNSKHSHTHVHKHKHKHSDLDSKLQKAFQHSISLTNAQNKNTKYEDNLEHSSTHNLNLHKMDMKTDSVNTSKLGAGGEKNDLSQIPLPVSPPYTPKRTPLYSITISPDYSKSNMDGSSNIHNSNHPHDQVHVFNGQIEKSPTNQNQNHTKEQNNNCPNFGNSQSQNKSCSTVAPIEQFSNVSLLL